MNDENKLLEENAKDSRLDKTCHKKKGKCKSTCMIFSIVFLLLILFGGKCLWDVIQTNKADKIAVKMQLEKLQGKIVLLENSNEHQQRSLNELRNLTKASKSRWIYAETAYLVQNAIYQIKLDHVEEANSLLNDAFEAISSVPDAGPSVNAIKGQISQAIMMLKSARTVDEAGMVAKINQLRQKVDNLSLAFPAQLTVATKNASAKQSEEIKTALKESWQEFKQMIVIRYHEKPTEPLVPPNQAIYVKQNLQLQLEQANLAVFYHNPTLYRLSLQKVHEWVEQFFDPKSKLTQDFLAQVDVLSKMNVVATIPDVEGILNGILDHLQPLIRTAFQKPAAGANMCSIRPVVDKPQKTQEAF